MLIAHYTGDHAGERWTTRAGVVLTRLGQKGPLSHITHTEALHEQHSDGSVTIASASMRDGGVRSKRVTLSPSNWIITDVWQWDVAQSVLVLPGRSSDTAYFCNRWVGQPYLKASGSFGPHHFAAICLSIGQDVTTDFFNSRAAQ